MKALTRQALSALKEALAEDAPGALVLEGDSVTLAGGGLALLKQSLAKLLRLCPPDPQPQTTARAV